MTKKEFLHLVDLFFLEYLARELNFDGKYGNQCVDLYRFYLKYLGLKQSPGVTGAADIWNNYRQEDFDRIIYAPGVIPEKGDVAIWSKSAGAGFGHVAIVARPGQNDFISMDINFPVEGYTDGNGNFIGTGKSHYQTHSFKNVLGFLRLKTTSDILNPGGNTMIKVEDSEAFHLTGDQSPDRKQTPTIVFDIDKLYKDQGNGTPYVVLDANSVNDCGDKWRRCMDELKALGFRFDSTGKIVFKPTFDNSASTKIAKIKTIIDE